MMVTAHVMSVRQREISATGLSDLAAEAGDLLKPVRVWVQRHQARRDLARMSEHLLKDIGLTPRAAAVEAAKPFWRA
jgi:uncharacterized protein YjiS (DUF1127 family)